MCAGIALSAPQARLTLDRARQFIPVLREASAKLTKSFFEDES
jgi:DNA-binding IclR family transcriptional regulator